MGDMKLPSELKKLIIETLKLEDIEEQDIKDDDPLFVAGLGLDSIDALELAVAIEKKYHIKLDNDKTAKQAFASIRTLAAFIESHAHG